MVSFSHWFDLLFESTPMGVLLVNVQGQIVRVNENACILFAYSRKELLGQPIELVVPAEVRSRHPSFLQGYMTNPVPRQMGNGRELWGARKGDVNFPIEVALNPVEIDGELFVLACVFDLTERRRQEEVHSRLAAIVESSQDALISYNVEGLIQTWNEGATKLLGYLPEEVIGKSVNLLLPEAISAESPEKMERFLTGLFTNYYDALVRRKNGELIDVSICISPLKNSFGKVVGASRIIRDMRIPKLYEEVLLESNKELEILNKELSAKTDELSVSNESLRSIIQQREDFLAAISHDLKNPLIASNRILKVLLGGEVKEPAQVTGLLGQLIDTNQSMLRMIWNLLDIYRSELGVLRPQLEKVNLVTLLNACMKEFAFQIQAKRLEVSYICELCEEERELLGDVVFLHRAIANLVDNAVKYTPAGGSIVLILKAAPGEIWLSIKDSGRGVPPEQREHLFDRFWQGELGREARVGIGIGLRLTRDIIEAHGGKLEYEGREGEGATFTISLPQARLSSP
jgi:PAS domain S-box-containing protein